MIERTHWDDCWKSGPAHYECAVGEVERLREYAQERALIHSQSLAAAEAEVERLRADAERYQWLRQNGSDSRVTEKDGFGGYCLKYDYDLDAAIDAARGES